MRLRSHVLPLLALAACTEIGGIADEAYVPPEPVPPPPDFGTWLSMDVSPEGGRLVISYYDRTNGNLGFAVGTPQADGTVAWLHEEVDGGLDNTTGFDGGDRGLYSSLRVAPDGTVWIASYDATAKKLRYAHRPGGGPATASDPKLATGPWVTGDIDSGSVGTWASLDLDDQGQPVVAYHDETNGTLKVARLVSADQGDAGYTWSTEVAWQGAAFTGQDADGNPIERAADVGEHARLAIVGGTEFIAAYDKAAQRLVLVEGRTGSYNGQFVSDEGLNAGQWPSILVDGGTVTVAYHDVGNQNLLVSTRSPAGWVTQPGDPAEWTGADTEVFKRGADIAVLYFDGQNNDMKLASKRGETWVQETVAGEGEPLGFHNEIVRLGDDWWAASYNFTTKSVKAVKLASTGGTSGN